MPFKIGDRVNTDYGSAFVIDTRKPDDDNPVFQVAIVVDGKMVWIDEDFVDAL